MKLTLDQKVLKDPVAILLVLLSATSLVLVSWYVFQFLYEFTMQIIALAPSNALTMR